MKKVKQVFALLVVMLTVFSNGFVAQAAEGINVRAGELTVTELSEEEMAMLSNEMTQSVIGGEKSQLQAANTSYTAYRYSQTFEFYNGDLWIADATAECIVWHYTDGKVHLYSRTISVSSLSIYGANKSYGSIVNTDGSYCYTTGDRVNVFNELYTWTYAIDFYADANDQYFSCYEV